MAGGLLMTRIYNTGKRFLKHLVALGAGFMIAVVFLELIPETVAQWKNDLSPAMGLILLGYLAMQAAEHFAAQHLPANDAVDPALISRRRSPATAVLALSIHAFFDGVAIASALLTNFNVGLLLFLAIMLHKVPEGFTAASVMLSAGRGERAAWRASMLLSAMTFFGIVSVLLLEQQIKYSLPFSAGVTLYVAASDLIPEVNHERDPKSLFTILIGVGLFYIAHIALHHALD